MKQTIMLTGATGFSGGHFLEYFFNHTFEEHKMVALCRSKNKLPQKFNLPLKIGDLNDEQYLEEVTLEADIICHTASWAELNGSVEASIENFLKPTFNLIDKALKNGVKRFIFLSAVTSNPIEQKRLHTSLSLAKIWAHYGSIEKIENYLKEKSGQGMEVVIVRAGIFTGENYGLGLLPILLPRLKTHLVPYIKKGSTSLPLLDGKDLAQGLALASTKKLENSLTIVDIVGKEIPTVKEVFEYLHQTYNYPLPHFSVPFNIAYLFARSVRFVHKFLPFEPLIVPSIVLLLEETNATNHKAKELLGYEAKISWQKSIDKQIAQMKTKQTKNMKMNKEKML